MKKLCLSLVLLLAFYPVFAQDEDDEGQEEQKEGWTKFGDFSLMFSQAAFNDDWQGGGTSNYAGDLSIEYHFNYKEDRLTWDNSFLGEYGLTRKKDDHFMRKTNDKLQILSVLGYKVAEESHWSYSFMTEFKTQFAKGFDFDEDTDTRIEQTRFMSPGYLKFGPGIYYKRDDWLKVNFSPVTSRFIFVSDRFTTIPGYVDGDYYGMDVGKSMRYEFGASLDASSRISLVDNVDLKQQLSLYSDYLDKPGNVDLDYRLKLDMTINEYLSANFTFQAIYEDKAVSAFQIREVIGVGFSYKLGES